MHRLFAPLVAALLTLMGVVMLTSALQENDTWDEGGHLAAGYGYWTVGDFGFNAEHPPLGNLLSAAPLLGLDLRRPDDHPSWRQRASNIAGAVFLFRNREEPERLLLLGRLPTMALTLLLGALMAVWARRHFGAGVAVVALALFAFDPNVIAHGRYITTDMIAALVIFGASIAWGRYLVSKRRIDLVWAGVALGIALASKFSALYLLPVFGLLYLLRCWQTGEWSLRDAIRSATVPAALSAFIVGASYGPETVALLTGRISWTQTALASGLAGITGHSFAGHPAYLLGEVSMTGWWYYFPVVFVLKTPIGTLALLAIAIACALIGRPSPRPAPFHWLVLTVPPAAYLLVSMTSAINIGVRHLLPVYPFLFILAPAVLWRLSWTRVPVAVCVTLLAIESLAIYPNYLAFFSAAAGGPANGAHYLVDSNLDWGGDVKKLKRFMDDEGIGEVCLAYFGNTDVAHWGVRHRPLPHTWEGRSGLGCVSAISATLLEGLYVGSDAYAWLRDKDPIARVGYSIYVYDLRK